MRKNILIIHKKFLKISETFIVRQINCLSDNNYLYIFSTHGYENLDQYNLKAKEKWEGTKITLLDRLWWRILKILKFNSGRISLINILRLYTYIKFFKISIIHTHYGWSGINFYQIAKITKVPFVVSFHGVDASKWALNSNYMKLLQPVLDYASAIIISSPHMMDTLKLYNHKKKVHVVPYGIDPHEFEPWPIERSSKTVILHSGRLVPKKGVADLIKAFSLLVHDHPHIELHILGSGTELSNCKGLVDQLKISKSVIFHGAQPIEYVKELMNRCDIFVLNSRTDKEGDMEGLPNSLLEAMSMKKAVVSTNHAGIPLAVRHMYSGLLVPESDNNSLTSAIETLINNADLRNELGENARQTITEGFTIERMQQGMNRIFESLLNER